MNWLKYNHFNIIYQIDFAENISVPVNTVKYVALRYLLREWSRLNVVFSVSDNIVKWSARPSSLQ